MAASNIELIVNAVKALNPLKQVDRATKKLSQTVKRTQTELKGLTKRAGQMGRDMKAAFIKAQRASEKFRSKLGGLKGAIIGLGVAAFTKRMIGQAASFAQTQVRLKALLAEYGEFGRIQELVGSNAKLFNQSQAESARNFSDVYARLRPLGTSLKDIQTVYKGFNATAIASGTEAAAASAAFLQLSQALGSGALQGDEFRSISEQVPGILKLVSDEMKVEVGELKKLGSEGKITADILINSLAKGFELNKDKIQQLLAESPAQKFKEFSNATSDLSDAVGGRLLPAVTPFVQGLTGLIKLVGELPGPIKTAGAGLFGLVAAVTVLTPIMGSLATGIGIVGIALGSLKALLITQAALISTFGVKIYATAAAAGVLTKAMVLLKGAMLALPWVALTAGIAYVAKGAFDARTKIDALEASLRDTSGAGEELTLKMQKTAEKIETLKGQLDKAGPSADYIRKKIELLTASLETMQGRYEIEIAINEIRADVRSKSIQGFDTLTPAELDEALGRNKPKPTGTSPEVDPTIAARENARAELQAISDQVALVRTRTDQETRMVELQQKIRDIDASRSLIGDDLADQRIQAERGLFTALEIKEFLATKDAEALKAQEKLNKAQEKADNAQKKAADDLKEKYKQVGDAIKSNVTDSIVAAIEGTKSLGESAMDILKNLANQLLRSGINQLFSVAGSMGPAGGILSMLFGGGRASGGTVKSGTSYMVGERGPELFTPGRSGSIAPNGSLGGGANVTVNVDASGSNVEGDGDQAAQLGKAIGIAVQQELVKQKRPGGLLAR